MEIPEDVAAPGPAALSPEGLRRVADVLEVVLGLEENLRPTYIAALGRSDPELHAWIERLIPSNGDHSRQRKPLPTSPPDPTAVDELRFGLYRAVESLGAGGMGTVYLAERSGDEFQRQVAIKVLRMGFHRPEILRRFLSERQILATFDHPNIARMYEGGTSSEGLPYLVMEYVEGLPIDCYCDENRLTIRQRLELFRDVCSAVEYSHQNLVVHRDLKPSNILVTEAGTAKLLDFGIAKLLNPDEFPLTVEATETGSGPLTPNFASPEQILGEHITTSTDIYSLGILLYKLLTGRLPFDRVGKPLPVLMSQMMRLEAVQPSLRVDTERAADEGETIDSGLWSVRPSTHRRQLQGDLDKIVLMAIRPEPQRRYRSVIRFADDLSRHLEGRPVSARKAGFFYHSSRFVGRHKLAITGALIILVLTITFLGVTLIQNGRITQQAHHLQITQDEAVQQQLRAEEIAGFFVDLFDQLAPENALGKDLGSRDILQRAAQRLREQPSEDALVQASLQTTIGAILHDFGDTQLALRMLEQAAQESRSLSAEVYARSLLELSRAQASVLSHREALISASQAAEIFDRLGKEAELADTLSTMALYSEESAEAEGFLARAGEIARRLGQQELLSTVLNNLALKVRSRDVERATALLKESLQLDESTLPPDHPSFGTTYGNLAFLYQTQGRLDEAGRLHEKALEVTVKTMGAKSIETAIRYNNVAQYRNLRGEYGAALESGRRALRIFEEALGPNNLSLKYPLNNIGLALLHLGRSRQAIEELGRSLQLTEDSGERHNLAALGMLGRAHRILAEDEQARRYLTRLRHIYQRLEAAGEPGSPRFLAAALVDLGVLEQRQGRLQAASGLWRQALEISDGAFKQQGVYLVQSRLLAKLHLGYHDACSEEIDFLLASGAKDRTLESFCIEEVPICESLQPLFPPTADL